MAYSVKKVDVWAGEIADRPGGLAEKIQSLSTAGANLEFLIARRAADKPGTGVVFVTPIKGAKQKSAAQGTGFATTDSLHSVRVEGPDKAGLGALLSFFAVSIVFWVIYNQNSTALTIWADTYTDRSMSEAGVKWTKPFGMLQTVTTDTVDITKVDSTFAAVHDENGKTIQTKGLDPYLQNLPKGVSRA